MRIPIEALELVRFAASRIRDRPNLEAIELRTENGFNTATTTDGHMLGRYTWQSDDGGLVHSPLLLRVETIAGHMKRISKKERVTGGELIIAVEGLQPPVCHIKLGGLEPEPIEVMDVNFPDTNSVIPSGKQLAPNGTVVGEYHIGAQFGVDLKLLARITDWAKACNRSTPGVVMKVTASGEFDPLRIEAEDGDGKVIFVVMPVRLI